jgi:hypothetical protein
MHFENKRDHGSNAIPIILIGIGLAALAVSMSMNGRFGWEQASSTGDRYLMSVQHLLIDPAAAALVALGGSFAARRLRVHAAIALICGLMLVGWSVVSVYGFMSSRIAVSQGHKAALKVQEDYLKWAQGQTVNFDRPKADRQAMTLEVKDAVQKLVQAAMIVPDAQAASIAEMFDTSPENVQRALVLFSSCIMQFIKIACLFYGCFSWSQRVPMGHTTIDSSGSDGRSNPTSCNGGNVMPFRSSATSATSFTPANHSAKSISSHAIPPVALVANGTRLTRKEALRDAKRLIAATGAIPSQKALATRWNCPPSTVSRWSKKWERSGEITRRSNGNCNVVSAGFASAHAAGRA